MAAQGKDRFLKVYANLPLNLRREIISVVDDEPVTWEAAYREVINDTKLGKKLIAKLIDMDVI